MRWFMYAVYDSAVGVYDRPFVSRSDGEAIRGFSDVAKDKEHPIGKHPEHYALFGVGLYDDNTGEITPEVERRCIARAHEVIGGGTAEAQVPYLGNGLRDEDVSLNPGGTE